MSCATLYIVRYYQNAEILRVQVIKTGYDHYKLLYQDQLLSGLCVVIESCYAHRCVVKVTFVPDFIM